MADIQYNLNCEITNNSGEDIIVLDAHAEGDDFKIFYFQELPVIKFITGDSILSSGQSNTIKLTRQYKSSISGEMKPVGHYQLICASPRTLRPIAIIDEEILRHDNPRDFPPITVTKDDNEKMLKALQFSQTIGAFPGSDLAKDFVAAMKSTEKMTLEDADATIEKFFKSTRNFTMLDHPAVMAFNTYTEAFAANWLPPLTKVPGQPEKAILPYNTYSYWLYSPKNMGGYNDATGTKSPATSASCEGVIAFKNYKIHSGMIADPTDPCSGWDVVISSDGYSKDGGSSARPLKFDHGQFVDQFSDAPAIALKGCWTSKSTFTHDLTDTSFWPILVGTMNGVDVIGIPMHPEHAWDKFAKFWQHLTFKKLLSTFLMVMGVAMALDFLYQKLLKKRLKGEEIKDRVNDGKELTPEQTQETIDAAAKAEVAGRAEQLKLAERMGQEGGQAKITVPDEAGIDSSQTAVKASQVSTKQNLAADATQEVANNAQKTLDTIDEYGAGDTDDLQDAIDDLSDKAEAARTSSEFSNDFANIKTQIDSIETGLKNIVAKAEQNLNSETKAELDNAQTAREELSDLSEETAKEGEAVDNGEAEDNSPFEPDDVVIE